MRVLSPLLCCISFVFCTSATLFPSSTRSSHSIGLEKRYDATLTVALGPRTNYLPPTPAATTLTGRAFSIVPGPQPTDGLDIYFGPDLASDINVAIDADCPSSGTPNWAKCQASISKLITPGAVDLQRRLVGALMLLIALDVVLIGVLIALLREHQPSTSRRIAHLHFPSTDAARLQTGGDKSAAIFPTATNDANPVTIIITPTALPTPSVVLETNGDITFHLDPDLARVLDDLIAVMDGCAISKDKRSGPSLDCIGSVSLNLMNNIDRGPAAPLDLLHDDVPMLRDPEVAAALLRLANRAAGLAPRLRLSQGQTRTLTRYAWLLVTYKVGGKAISPVMTFAGSLFDKNAKKCPDSQLSCNDAGCKGQKNLCTTGDNTGCPCSDECPPIDRTPACINCGGEKCGSAKCIGFPNYHNLWAGCDCIAYIESIRTIDPAEAAKLQNILKNAPTATAATAATADYYCSSTKVKVDEKQFQDIFKIFCNGLDLTKKQTKTISSTLAGDVGLVWTPKYPEGCGLSCTSIFDELTSRKDCVDGGNVAQLASLLHMCGTAQWGFNTNPAKAPQTTTSAQPSPSPSPPLPPPPPPPPPPTPLSLGPQNCHGRNEFGSHADISPSFQDQYVGFACTGSANRIMQAGDPPVVLQTNINGAPYRYVISWVDGCTTTAKSQNAFQPLPSDDKVTCFTLFREDWSKCNNGGVGGSRSAGCLNYEFAATYK